MYKVIKTTNLKTNEYFYGVIQSEKEGFDYQLGQSIDIREPNTYQFSKTKFQQAIKQYGVKSFKVDVLFITHKIGQAYKVLSTYLTPEIIASKDCYNNVYVEKINDVYVYDLKGHYLEHFKSCLDSDLVLNGLQLNRMYICNYKDFSFSKAKKMYIQNRPVYKYDIYGNYIAKYRTQTEAEKLHKYSNITKAIKLKQPCKNGFFWTLQKLPKLNWKDRIWIGQFDLEGNYIRGWKFRKQCYRAVGEKVMNYINKNIPYNGFIYKSI